MGDALVEGKRRWSVAWIHDQVADHHLHPWATVSAQTARAGVTDLLASGWAPSLHTTLWAASPRLVTSPAARLIWSDLSQTYQESGL